MSARIDKSVETTIKCPICGQSISSSEIYKHADACLGDDIEIEGENDNIRDPGPGPKKAKGWDFLSGYNQKKRGAPKLNSRSSKKGKFSNNINAVEKGMKSVDKTLNSGKRDTDDSSSDVECIEDEEAAQNKKAGLQLEKTGKSKAQRSCPKTNSIAYINANKRLDTNATKPSAFTTSILDSANLKLNDNNMSPNSFFSTSKPKTKKSNIDLPLAEKVRPSDLNDYVGQQNAVGKKALLHSLLVQCEKIPSMILWGPPGCGKTTLAKIIAKKSKELGTTKFLNLSATSASVGDVKEAVKVAKNDMRMFNKKTIMFLDEIHRFNKLQQDVLLPHVEDGTLTLIGATTENPSFQVNKALLSRCRVIVLAKLEIEDIKLILYRALSHLNVSLVDDKHSKDVNSKRAGDVSCENNNDLFKCGIESEAVEALAGLVDGDARAALNGLQLAVESILASAAESNKNNDKGSAVNGIITVEDVKEGLQKSHIMYDKKGEDHYNTVSALIKSMRGSHANAALYWMARMLEGGEDPMFVARRLVIFASEDIGMADPQALVQAVSTMQACHMIGMPECAHNLSQCTVYLSRAPKSVACHKALAAARECVRTQVGAQPPVPLHLRNAPSKFLKNDGNGEKSDTKSFLPPSMEKVNFFNPAGWSA